MRLTFTRALLALAAFLVLAAPASAARCHRIHHRHPRHHLIRCLQAYRPLAFRAVVSHTRRKPKPPTPTPAPAGKVYWGATIGPQFTGGTPPWDMNAVSDFENQDAGGKKVSVIAFGETFHATAWYGPSGVGAFQTTPMQTVRDAGAIPELSWSSTNHDNPTDPAYTNQAIANGSQDAYLTQWAQAAKAWGHPLFLRFDWEMNGDWYPWSPGNNGSTAANFVAMWRHVHDIFTSVGATNVNWVWCPNIDQTGTTWTDMQSLYPGDAYVNWTCLDAYNGGSPWTSFHDLISSSYDRILGFAPSKPMMIAETATTENGGSKATWITDLLSGLTSQFPDIHALLWYDDQTPGPGGNTDWPVESSPSSIAAFTAGIASSDYFSNQYGTLSASPIPAP